MPLIKNILACITSIAKLSIVKILHFNNLKYSVVDMISARATIHINGKQSKLILRKVVVVRANTEISVLNGYIEINESVFINKNCMIVCMDKIIIGSGTCIGPGVMIYDHDHNFNKRNIDILKYNTAPIVIGRNVWIGAGSIILKGVTIGDGSVIGAGAIITKDIPANTIATTRSEIILKDVH